jgi:Transposase DDE domain group 1
VRRVKLLPPAGTAQPALVEGYRYHAVLTDSPLTMLQAETCHRGHAIIEQVIADLKNGPLAHLPSGRFAANAAWLTLAAIAHNLTRAAGCLASTFHALARPATIRDQLINIAARIATSARRITLHMPTRWRWEDPWRALITAVT